MQRASRTLGQIVPPTVWRKVERLWPDRAAAATYLRGLVSRTLQSRQGLAAAAAGMADSALWVHPRLEADMDLARVYAVAAWCVPHTDTSAALAEVLHRVPVRQLAAQLPAPGPWPEADLFQAGQYLLSASGMETGHDAAGNCVV